MHQASAELMRGRHRRSHARESRGGSEACGSKLAARKF
jgi:hypothetical protein